MHGTNLTTHPIHLGLDASAGIEPAFNGSIDWYAAYQSRHESDGVEARLVSMHTFREPWDSWEMHPHGSEVVLCIAGSMTLHQQQPAGSTRSITLGPGQYAINEAGSWHTADIAGEATAVFITAGLGTRHRPR